MVSVMDFKTTAELKVSEKIADQVIGQDEAVEVIKKAAAQRRHVMLIGEPGTGKSLLGQALAELLPKEKLVDILAFLNPNDENQPIIRTCPAGKGRDLVAKAKIQTNEVFKVQNIVFLGVALVLSLLPYYFYSKKVFPFDTPIVFAASMISSILFLIGLLLMMSIGKRMLGGSKVEVPKVIVDNFGKKSSCFVEATGAHAGALLGDVLHDPLQSGGLGTPAHERVTAGMIHKAHMGVLFIDEVATLNPIMQQELLTAMQEGKYPITGQSERSSGAMVRTEPVPCSFILVAAGNNETVQHMHPALRSRIRGYGYEVYMKDTMLDNDDNRLKIAIFIAQEVVKDKKIPHFSKDAVMVIIDEARRLSNRKGHLTIRFRELGGLVRAAGDLAMEDRAKFVNRDHVIRAKKLARSLEQQIADKFIERKKEYDLIVTKGVRVGRVNGLAVIGTGASFSGIILPIESEVTAGGKEKEIVATGKLGTIAKEAVKNVSAIIKKYFGADIKDYDIYVQFLQTYEGVEGDSASIAVATSIISALQKVPVKQEVAMTGSLSVRGEVLPVGGVSAKVEAAIDAGMKKVIIPKSNLGDIVVDAARLKKIELIPAEFLWQVLKESLEWKGRKDLLDKITSG